MSSSECKYDPLPCLIYMYNHENKFIENSQQKTGLKLVYTPP